MEPNEQYRLHSVVSGSSIKILALLFVRRRK